MQGDQQRASVPAFGEWDEMKAAGVLPDYSLDFSKIRAVRMQRKETPLPAWSSAGDDAAEVAVATASGGETGRPSSSVADVVDDRDRHHSRHRRQHSDGSDIRRPLRHDHDRAAPKVTNLN
ncbi:hypothetical protein ABZP36_008657 [Zizania latifolia]